ncbi:ribosome biogenesis GTPase [Amphibacillus marinus]|uniref:Small ribosomal subunit biogenesis GTPase RsgA n=1 Tax=Amphibacillus marinus TaxID=872970 RepID=A0A1H8HYA2_9BACI|nr:ribosome small subunit-dependent GTPase A [Amphibacillus marinus]SEN61031.1 ribosome biogenesis GTPase [Amphibacillus marinus]
MLQGQIMKALSGFYYVLSEDTLYQCRARGLFRKNKQTPLVGDQVIFEADNTTDGYIIELLPRENDLIRPPIANVDQALIAVSAKEPDFSTVLLDRFLVLVEANRIKPVILVTKMDLVADSALADVQLSTDWYRKMGYDVHFLSKEWSANLEQIQTVLQGKTSVIAGQSGVGKSSFLNYLNPDLAIKTAEISNSLGRGKHTTRHVELVEVAGGLVADTPGFSSLEFDQLELTSLPECFPDFLEYSDNCKFRSCTHIKEPKCAVKQALDKNEIASFRYAHYLQFYQEIQLRKPRY